MPDTFTPDKESVELRPTAMNLGYTVTTDDLEAICIYLETPDLGAFRVLLAPESVPAVAAELSGLAADLPRYRQQWAEQYGTGQ